MKKERIGQLGVLLRLKGQDHGFHWAGRDKTGISRWTGNRGALKWGGLLLGVIGGVLLVGGTLVFLATRELYGFSIMAGVGALQIGLSWWMKRLHDNLSPLVTAEEIASAIGVQPEDVEQLKEQQEVKPRAVLNDEYLYDPADFRPGSKLLRPSDPPTDDVLLRPAASASIRDEILLHPVHEEETPAPTYGQAEEPDTLRKSH